jgi:hypothetical protein
MSSATPQLPNLAEFLSQVVQRVPPEQQPLLIALAERLAAERYRRWAGEISASACRTELLTCADREEEIARRIEALYPDAASIQNDILVKFPDLEEINRTLFAGRPLEQQFTIQAQGERLGAITWRSLAQSQDDPETRETFGGCAELEEESAAVLEAMCGSKA